LPRTLSTFPSLIKPTVPQPAKTGNAEQDRFAVDVGNALRQLLSDRSYSVIDTTIGTSATKVVHRLGRPIRGWRILDQTADATVWRVDGPASDPEDLTKHIYLQASASVTVRLQLF